MNAPPRRLVWIGAGLALLAAAVALGGGAGWSPPTFATAPADTVPCGSCTARHQHLTRTPMQLEKTP